MLDLISTDTLADSLSGMLQPLMYLFSALTIVSILVGIAFIVHAVRSWRVQSATLQMQKDIAEIKEQIRSRATPVVPKPQVNSQKPTDIARQ